MFANSVERLRGHQADHLVRLRPQLRDGVCGRNWNRQDEPAGSGVLQPLQRRPHRSARSDAIIDHDGDAALHIDRPPAREIMLAPTLDLLQLLLGFPPQCSRAARQRGPERPR